MIDSNGPESKTSIKVEVKRLDHGDTTCLSLWNVKELTPELATLPLQAVQVSLANVIVSLLMTAASLFDHIKLSVINLLRFAGAPINLQNIHGDKIR